MTEPEMTAAALAVLRERFVEWPGQNLNQNRKRLTRLESEGIPDDAGDAFRGYCVRSLERTRQNVITAEAAVAEGKAVYTHACKAFGVEVKND